MKSTWSKFLTPRRVAESKENIPVSRSAALSSRSATDNTNPIAALSSDSETSVRSQTGVVKTSLFGDAISFGQPLFAERNSVEEQELAAEREKFYASEMRLLRLRREMKERENSNMKEALSIPQSSSYRAERPRSSGKAGRDISGYDSAAAANFVPVQENSRAVKQMEEKLIANAPQSTEQVCSSAQVLAIGVYRNFGGLVSPWRFFDVQVVEAFTSYLADVKQVTLHPDYPLAFHYRNMAPGSDCQFLVDWMSFVMHENGTQPEDLISNCKMTASKTFSGSDVRTYTRNFKSELARIGTVLKDIEVASKYASGLHPLVIGYLAKHCDYFNRLTFEDAQDKVKWATGKIEIHARSQIDFAGLSLSATSSCNTGAAVQPKCDAKSDAKSEAAKKDCHNCHGDHHISDCKVLCRRCPASSPCGKLSRDCPVFLKYKADRALRAATKSGVQGFYKAHNAQVEQIAKDATFAVSLQSDQACHKLLVSSSSISIPSSPLPVYRALSPTTVAVDEEPDSNTLALVDTGCNGFITPSETELDKNSKSSTTSQVTIGFPNASNLTSSGKTGEFLGHPVHIVKEFKKTLVPADFFTKKNALLIVIDEKMCAVRLTPSILAKVTDLLAAADDEGSMLLTIPRKNGLYPTTTSALRKAFEIRPLPESRALSIQSNSTYFSAKLSNMEETVRFWHVALGHPSKAKLISMTENNVIDGFPLSTQQVKDHFTECPDCFHGNLSQKRHPQEADRVYVTGKTLSIDVIVGGGDKKHPVRTHSGEGFAVLCIDRGSDKSWCFMTNTISHLLEFVQRIDRLYALDGHNLEEIQIDSAFYTKEIQKYCEERPKGTIRADIFDEASDPISPLVTAPYEHAQNGAAECLAKIFYSGVTKQLHWANLSIAWWGDCALWFNDARNDQSSDRNPTMSRGEAWNGVRTDVSETPIFPFGSRVKSHVPLTLQSWDTTRCRDGIVIGRSRHHKGSIVIRHLDTMKTVVRYTFKVLGQRDIEGIGSGEMTNIGIAEAEDGPELHFNHLTGTTSTKVVAETLQQDGTRYRAATARDLNAKQKGQYQSRVDRHFTDGSTGVAYKIVGIDFQVSDADGKISSVPKTPFFKHYDTALHEFPPRDDGDYEWMPCAELLRDPDTEWIAERNVAEANSAQLCYEALKTTLDNDWTNEFECYHVLLNKLEAARVDITDISPPKKYADLATHPEKEDHLASFLREVGSFKKRGMCIEPDVDIKDIPPELIMQLMPIWTKKYEGLDFVKFKCRIVGLGQYWKNIFGEATTSGMANMETVKAFLAVGAATGMILSKVDSETAFLQAELLGTDAPYYVRAPPGVPESIMPRISQPRAYVYGHPKAGRQFTLKYKAMLLRHGWIQSVFDPCSYTLQNAVGVAHLLTIVDDSPILADSIAMRDSVHASIASEFKITIDNDCKHVAGLDVQQNGDRTYTLRQDGASVDLFDGHVPNWRDLDPYSLPETPMSSVSRMAPLTAAQQARSDILCSAKEIKDVQSQLGSINWLTLTQPDLLFGYKAKAPTATKATAHDQDEIMRIMLYMVRMFKIDNLGLTVGGTLGVQLYATVDTSFACHPDMKSHTGGTIHLGPQYGAFSAFSEKQSIQTDSTPASEGVGGHMISRRVLPLRFYLEELLHPQLQPSRVAMDNVPYMQSALSGKGLSKNVKHVLIRVRVTDAALENKEITLEHLRTVDMVADILTKPLAAGDFHRLRRVLLGADPVQTSLEYVRDPKLYCNFVDFRF